MSDPNGPGTEDDANTPGHFTPRTSGTHFFSADGFGVGQYTIRITEVVDDFADNVDSTGVFAGGVASGRIEEPGDSDFFNIDLHAFTQYDYSLNAPAGVTVMIVNADGIPVHYGEQSGAFVPTGTGRYSFVVIAQPGSGDFAPANYSLTLASRPTTDDFSNNVNTNGFIDLFPDAYGLAAGSIGATWNYVTDSDWFRVELTANNTYVIGGDGFLDGEEGSLTIVDANGNLVSNFGSTFLAEGGNNGFAFTPGATGAYFIQANASGPPGDYFVSVQQIVDDFTDSGVRPGSLTVNGQSSGILQANGDVDYFAVSLTAGQSYSVFNGAGGFTGDYFGITHVVGPDGSRHDNVFSATQSGTYYVAVSGFAFSPDPADRAYQVGIDSYVDDFTNNALRTGTLTVGGSAQGAIEVSGDTDWFAVTLTANQRYVFATNRPSGNMEIYNEAGHVVGDVRSFTPTASGIYYLSFNDGRLGGYSVSVQAVPDDYVDNATTTGRFTGSVGPDASFGAMTQVTSTFGAGPGAGGWGSQNDFPRQVADINGDGRADIVGFGLAGTYVSLGQANGTFGPMVQVNSEYGRSSNAGSWTSNDRFPRLLADMNGDGNADIVGFRGGGTYVSLANGNGGFGEIDLVIIGFGTSPNAGGWESQNLYHRTIADVNGDGRNDIVGFGEAGTYVALANANGTFGSVTLASDNFGRAAAAGGWESHDRYPRMLADINGDGRADIVGFGEVGTYVALANANGTFGAVTMISGEFGRAASAGGWSSQNLYARAAVDVNGDGLADLVGFGEAGVYLAMNGGAAGFEPLELILGAFGRGAGAGGWSSHGEYPRLFADLNADGIADIVGFGQAGVYVSLGTAVNGVTVAQTGQESANNPIDDLIALVGDAPLEGGADAMIGAFEPVGAGDGPAPAFAEFGGSAQFASLLGLEELSNVAYFV